VLENGVQDPKRVQGRLWRAAGPTHVCDERLDLPSSDPIERAAAEEGCELNAYRGAVGLHGRALAAPRLHIGD
jgi:hypothetical protein